MAPTHEQSADLADERHRRPVTDYTVFGAAAALTVGFLLWGVLDSDGIATVTGDALGPDAARPAT